MSVNVLAKQQNTYVQGKDILKKWPTGATYQNMYESRQNPWAKKCPSLNDKLYPI